MVNKSEIPQKFCILMVVVKRTTDIFNSENIQEPHHIVVPRIPLYSIEILLKSGPF